MADGSGAVDLSASSAPTEDKPKIPEEKPPVLAAFAVIIGFDGNPQVVTYEHDDFVVQHPATPDLIYGAAQTIIKDIQATETAQATLSFQMQQAQAIAQQRQAQQVQQSLGNIRG